MKHLLASGRTVEITSIAQRPELAGAEIDVGGWSEFMRHNRISEAYFWQTLEAFPATCLIATAEDGSAVADAQAVQPRLGGPDRAELPAGGWEEAVVWAFADARRHVVPNAACALNISVARGFQGLGLAGLMLTALREAVADAGLADLVAPVRPTRKHLEPRTSMAEYAGEGPRGRPALRPVAQDPRQSWRPDRRGCPDVLAGLGIARGVEELDRARVRPRWRRRGAGRSDDRAL